MIPTRQRTALRPSHAGTVVLAALLVFSLASCATPGQAPEAAPAAVPAAAPAASPAPESAAADNPVEWTEDAQARFTAEVPKMVQKIARKEMEKQARLAGRTTIDLEFYEEQKAKNSR